MKARRDAEDEAKRATESSDEEVRSDNLAYHLTQSCFQESETSEDETEDDTDSESGSDSDV